MDYSLEEMNNYENDDLSRQGDDEECPGYTKFEILEKCMLAYNKRVVDKMFYKKG